MAAPQQEKEILLVAGLTWTHGAGLVLGAIRPFQQVPPFPCILLKGIIPH
jgi:hypothetical protein